MTDKVITHEEATEAHTRLFDSYLDGCFIPFPTRSDLDTIKKYITQQEKKNKLLEMYKESYELLKEVIVKTGSTRKKWARLKELEKELRGMEE